MTDHPILPAVIVQIPCRKNGYSYEVYVDTKGIMFLRGLGAPSPGRVGEEGVVQYTTGANYGLYFWRGSQ